MFLLCKRTSYCYITPQTVLRYDIRESIRWHEPKPCQKMLLIIKPWVLSAVQQLSSHPGLALFNSINIVVRLSPPNNYELQIAPPFRAIILITLDCKDADIERQAILPQPSSHHHGTGICTFQMHQHIWVTTAMIFSNLVVITWIHDTYDKMSDNYCFVYLCRHTFLLIFLQYWASCISSPPCSRDPFGPWSMLVLAGKNLLPLCTHSAGTHNCYPGFRLVPGI